MSRIGKRILSIPEKVSVVIAGDTLTVKGPLGEISKKIPSDVKVMVEGTNITLTLARETLETRAMWGTVGSHIKNMLDGVQKPFEKKLIVEGIGFKADVKGKELHMALGFSHPVVVAIPEGLKVTSEKNVVTISGIDCDKVGSFAGSVREFKKPEPYKGKGIRYSDEVIRRKQGKKSV